MAVGRRASAGAAALVYDSAMSTRALRDGLLAAAVLWTARASALQQSNGTTIPVINPGVTTCSDNNIQVCLDQEEGGPTINALASAATTPETYKPICGLTFKVIARGAGYKNTFGWYNATGGKPPASDLHSFLECSDPVGTVKVLNIKSSPYYQGGEIGFFMATPQGTSGNCPQFNAAGGPVGGTVGYVYYSQKAFNPEGPNGWIHLITYNSVKFPNSFYFGWEDLFNGGDNDFDDILTRVEGIQCSGGGDPCTVAGQQGKCANGTMQCQNGTLTCVQTNQPTTEQCNALDDDCNGQTDEGDLCPPKQICYKGVCVPACGVGEFQCSSGLKCANGLCVDPACETVTCKAGEICLKGQCVGACDGVICPFGQSCVEGACVDPCASIKCDSDFVCVAGVCKVNCNCDGCSGGKQCDTASGKCEESGCTPNPCGPGTHCIAGGICVDDCQGAVCPKGQACSAGQCVASSSDAGVGGAGGGSGGITFGGGTGGGANAGGGGSGAKDGGISGTSGGTEDASDSGGCGCRVGSGRTAPLALASALGALAFALSRRRRRG
jgi:hypothetical protein